MQGGALKYGRALGRCKTRVPSFTVARVARVPWVHENPRTCMYAHHDRHLFPVEALEQLRSAVTCHHCPPCCSGAAIAVTALLQVMRPLQYRLEVYKTKECGWGVRSWDTIYAGSFVCFMAGRIKRCVCAAYMLSAATTRG